MKLRPAAIDRLATMIAGDGEDSPFPYRSSSYLTKFFARCDLPFTHDGSTRGRWVEDRLKELNSEPSAHPDLPNDKICRVIQELLDGDDFDRWQKDQKVALVRLNLALQRDGLEAQLDQRGQVLLRNTGAGVDTSARIQSPRPLSREEKELRMRLSQFLDQASEDEFTERLLVPFFQLLGFHRVSATGHKEKILEFGKDMWMRYTLPTGHNLYFCAQVKREKLDASGGSGNSNAATVLNQVRMAFENPIFDPDAGRKILVDHVFVICSAEITRAAKHWLVEQLDNSQRRAIIFMERGEFLDHAAKIATHLDLPQIKDTPTDDATDF